METAIIKVSSKGQVVIPAELRRLMGITEGDELYVFGKDDALVLKKIDKKILEKEFEEIVKPIRAKAKKLGITRKDVEREILAYRREKRKKHESGS
ncbi:MAG: AbrB/MazE/SpoVT family DNA-binding domain-containing protein [Thermoplasmata archaeon]|nr:AbrB/MazE/SpoVT family DNA-binding domain-containing protein [Thermoplasmata archaeon]